MELPFSNLGDVRDTWLSNFLYLWSDHSIKVKAALLALLNALTNFCACRTTVCVERPCNFSNIRISENDLASDLVCADEIFKNGIFNVLGKLIISKK